MQIEYCKSCQETHTIISREIKTSKDKFLGFSFHCSECNEYKGENLHISKFRYYLLSLFNMIKTEEY